jgi:hypothetical protein
MNKKQLCEEVNTVLSMFGLTIPHMPAAPNCYIVSCGGGLLMIGLREECDDIDMSVNMLIWKRAIKKGYKPITKPFRYNESGFITTIEIRDNGMKTDLHLDIPTVESPHIWVDGIRVLSPELLLKEKLRMNRPKDQNDIVNLKKYLGQIIGEVHA